MASGGTRQELQLSDPAWCLMIWAHQELVSSLWSSARGSPRGRQSPRNGLTSVIGRGRRGGSAVQCSAVQ
jgi:hypothetical protein